MKLLVSILILVTILAMAIYVVGTSTFDRFERGEEDTDGL